MSNKPNAREAIVDCASKLFFTQGYHATGLNQIIKESESPKGSLYYYFPHGKEELALTCIHRTSDIVTEKLKDLADTSPGIGEAMREFLLGMAEEAVSSSYERVVPFSFWLAVETSCVSEELRQACQTVFSDWQEVVKQHLMEEGVGETEAADKASVAVSLFEGALLQTLTFRDEQPLLAAAKLIPALLS
ncbi:putative HTH-type transcriptional regulator YxaF [Paenibacillus albidus]|uniref:HTH-type transcriptional regulator YxaF n=1 Tax=Paenibacillus albidus TaxID=2041023 RepID=A0A917FDD0_9BACL|nr:TetR/AcrR family transcriptional regulator [Paenibacillus albidus]GGF68503.1 putative HTH-type transcriptional regulator YxaF [Paenibacillus albidus]